MYIYTGGTDKKLTIIQDNCQHHCLSLLPSTLSVHLGLLLLRIQVASAAFIYSLCKHPWDILLYIKCNCFLRRTDKTAAADFLLFKSSLFLFSFLSTSIQHIQNTFALRAILRMSLTLTVYLFETQPLLKKVYTALRLSWYKHYRFTGK